MKKTIRETINRDDGHCFQICNRDINGFEIAGYLLVLVALLVFLVVNKLALGSVWIGWLFFASGLLLVGIGGKRASRRS